MATTIRLGTQGWSYDDWKGVFYPPGAKQEDRLPFYSSVFDTVELDTTFYHAPRPTIARSWARHTPDEFKFAAKVPRALTHDAHLRGVGEQLELFVRAMDPLGDKLGPLLVQMPAEFTRDDSALRDLDTFLGGAPKSARLAIEFRHASWHDEAVYEVLRRHNAAVAWTEWRELPRLDAITADFLYLRWLGDRREIAKYDRVQIDRSDSFVSWHAALSGVLGQVREVYGYFNNHWAGHSPESANEMKRRLGLPFVEPKDAWPQGELFS
ncbi:MAG: DUF72 domain-containing protein [Candidatus Eisenbacteria bacterium]|nr:DUF72 domain-containing protein [Candidatus Eisenbacteria bacterium]